MEWYFSILTLVANFLTDPVNPADSKDWTITQPWTKVEMGWEFIAQSNTVSAQCRSAPNLELRTPNIIQGAHFIYLSDKLVYSTAEPDYRYGASMNNSASIPCYLLSELLPVTWKVIATTGSYTIINKLPQVRGDINLRWISSHTIPASSFGILLILGVVVTIAFAGKGINKKILRSFLISNTLLALHFGLTTPEYFGVKIPPFYLHRIHDILLWSGVLAMWGIFYELKMIGRTLQIVQASIVMVSIFIIVSARDIDQAQVGSTFAYLINLVLCLILLIRTFARYIKSSRNLVTSLQTTAIFVFIASGINDLLTHLGLINSFAIYPFGTVAVMIFLCFLVNVEVTRIYREHDDYRQNLQSMVDEKTAHLEESNRNLSNLKAEAIESAKLVSIGTLATGMAHEINNSLNYVNGSLGPLKKLMFNSNLSEKEQGKANKLFDLVDEGMELTLEIIKSLKIYASSDGKDLQSVDVGESIQGSLAILRSRLGAVKIQFEMLENHKVSGRRVGLSQIFINLISNAADALNATPKSDKKIQIRVHADETETRVQIEDNGPGMGPDVISRIFEPFFTTKDVGVGTGLGLYIVRKEAESMGARIDVQSIVGMGTTFTVTLNNASGRKTVA